MDHQVIRRPAPRPSPPTKVTSIAFRLRPPHLIISDFWLAASNTLSALTILWPVLPPSPANKLSELYLWDYRNWLAIIEQAVLVPISIGAVVLPLAFIWLPTIPWVIVAGYLAFYYILANYGTTIIDPWKGTNVKRQWEIVPDVPGER